jgi:hypothetical protein
MWFKKLAVFVFFSVPAGPLFPLLWNYVDFARPVDNNKLYSVLIQSDQDRGTLPGALMRPQRGEAPRYPRDAVIGELGRGTAAGEAYFFARSFMTELIGGNGEVLSSLASPAEILSGLEELKPEKYRLGGGREEADGSVSFLFRFIGRERMLTGELHLRFEEDRWELDDLILDEIRDITEGTDGYRFDFPPYERFF